VEKGTPTNIKIRVNGIIKYFDRLHILDDISFDVRENEFLSIVGPTGCGKTTLAKIIADILKPTAGTVLVDEVPVEEYGKIISFVFQQDASLPWMTVLKNVMIGMKIGAKGELDESEMEERAREMIDLVNLEGYESYYPIQLSGGMKQRMAIARAFCLDTEILIMDEPFGQIDVQTRYYMEQELLKIWERYKRTVIFITNHEEEAVTLSDRVIKLTPHPARILQKVAIDLPRPRDILSSEFMAYRTRLAAAGG
jgi:ABC-type nitrate/sulfonate/bicarbonate transport system ATPase subunit